MALTTNDYDKLLHQLNDLLDQARRSSSRAVNSILTATYWEIGKRIIEFEQGGETRALYGESLLPRLSEDLTARFGRGFSIDNLENMRRFYLCFQGVGISETLSRKFKQAPSLPLPWSAYIRLLSVKNAHARSFYEAEALKGGWSVRQLDRQISAQFYERTMLSRNKAAMLTKGAEPKPEDMVTPEEEIKDPYVLEFLGLKDEYSESDLEEALVRHLESFLLELGGDFTFVARQKRLRIGDEWYRIDLLLYHRRLHCLVVIDLKLGRFTSADAGQMHTYLNYAARHWTHADENPPVGLILCAQKNEALARYALNGLSNKILAAQYQTALPEEKKLESEILLIRRRLEDRGEK